MEYNIKHVPENNRFETEVNGMTANAEYHIVGKYLNITHVWVPKPLEGQGIASALVKAVYNYTKENNLDIRASCPFAAIWLERNTDNKG